MKPLFLFAVLTIITEVIYKNDFFNQVFGASFKNTEKMECSDDYTYTNIFLF